MTKRPLKVFRTSTGFDDAYIATTSRRAALEAWGTDKDLFARGAAEQITDPELMALALQQPGEVVRLPRASAAQHLSAAGPVVDGPSRKKRTPAGTPSKPRKRPPRPSRAALDAARAALDRQERELTEALNEFDRKIEALRERRVSLRQTGIVAAEGLRAAVAREEEVYRNALDAWEAGSG